MLFAIFLNDLELGVIRKYAVLSKLASDINQILSDGAEHFPKIYVLLYGGDTLVLAESFSELQKALDAVHQHCERLPSFSIWTYNHSSCG